MEPVKFAVLGHPNEGKSSVVSTLTENEKVRISASPGETTRCTSFTIQVENEAAMEIIDTPGFQNPAATLEWFAAWKGEESQMVDAFIKAHAQDKSFHHDLEIMIPLKDRAGVLYVADASRPLREADRQEMELLRCIGLPRMALLNCKRENRSFLPEWEAALKRRFNLVREFNAHRATFSERMDLFDAMGHLLPGQAAVLQKVRTSLQEEWSLRIEESVLSLESLLIHCLRHQVKIPFRKEKPAKPQMESARETYRSDLRNFEERAHRQWRRLFHHESLPGSLEDGEDLLEEELFAERVWQLLGLSRSQLALAGAVTGSAAGAAADIAAGGITFGVFTAGGALLGGLGSWVGGPKLGAKRLPFPGKHTLAREKILVGPLKDPQLMFVLLDRSLLYLTRLMNWAHGRRDHEQFLAGISPESGLVRTWSDPQRKAFSHWMKVQTHPGHKEAEKASESLREQLQHWLQSQTHPE
ncbi:MAG: DUF3482 domain-containing protein [Kiritimatiellia bacterium]